MKTFLIILIVVLSLAIAVGGFFIAKELLIKPAATTPSATPKASATISPSASPATSDLQKVYDAVSDIEVSTAKAKTVDAEVKPVLKAVFADNVKLKEDLSGSMLTYITNREVVAADVTNFKSQMEAAGYRTIDSSEAKLTLSKGANTLVFTFPVGDATKATIEMTL